MTSRRANPRGALSAILGALLVGTMALLVGTVAPSVGHEINPDVPSLHADLRIDDKRGLRVRVDVEIPAREVAAAFLATADDPRTLDAEAERAFHAAQLETLASTFSLRLGDAAANGTWRPADDPRNTLATDEVTFYSLEFEPADGPIRDARVEVRLEIDTFPDRAIELSAATRAKPPFRVVFDGPREQREALVNGAATAAPARTESAHNAAQHHLHDDLQHQHDPGSRDPRLRIVHVVFEQTGPPTR
ncbi:MAG: hypothetical protein AAGN46_01955 [Acidobacteriota bacterium]